ncbi:MAG: aldo/keto reductase [Bryobacterales bacterium]|nr:aldo/keto reductase [Bryobacterales bacterium]
MPVSRRAFLESAAATTLAAQVAGAAESKIPMRTLGKTGAKVTQMAFGCGSRFLSYKDEEQALQVLNRAIDLGIRYMDTAYGYGSGVSETRVGKVMKTRRKEVWLATKVNARKGDEAMRIIEGSLKRLQTDQVDLLHIHSLTDEEDLKAIEANDGVLKVLYKVRDQKMARFIGVTSHTDPTVLKTALERHDFDCTQMALNAAHVGMKNGAKGMEINSAMKHSFEKIALPVAKRKNMGVIAMKIFGQEGLVGKAPINKLIQYSLSLPVAAVVLGMPKPEFLEENVKIVQAFAPMPRSEMNSMAKELEPMKAELDRFFANHVDA